MLLFIFPHSPGFHFSCDDLSSRTALFLDFLGAPLFSLRRISRHPFLVSLSISCSVFARCNARPISRYPLTCRRFFTRRHLSSHRPPRALLTIRRTLESHKALRRIFHAAISASRDERRYSSRRPIRPEKNGEISFERGVGRNFLGLLSNVLMQNDD